jgi:hypothetical protein
MNSLLTDVTAIEPVEAFGRVAAVRGLLIEVAGPLHLMGVGARLTVEASGGRRLGVEVIGFEGGRALCLPFGPLDGVRMGCRAVITAACHEEVGNQYEEAMANNGAYLTKLVTEHGVEVRNFNDDVWDGFGRAAAASFEEIRAHSDLATRIDDSFQATLREIGAMMARFEGTFVNQRNRVLGIDA